MNIKEKTLSILDKLLEEAEFCGFSTSLNLSPQNFVREGISAQDVIKVFVRIYTNGGWQLDRYAPDEDYDYLSGKKKPLPEDKIFAFDFISYLKIYRLRRELLDEVGPSIISKDALTVISKEISWNEDAENIGKKLLESGVGKNLIDNMPGKSFEMVNNLFIYLATSKEKADHNLLFQLIGGFSHPLFNKNDFDLAQYKADEFSRALQYDGLCVNNWRVEKITSEIIKELQERSEERAQRNGDEIRLNYFSDDIVEFPHQINLHSTENSENTKKSVNKSLNDKGIMSYFDLRIDTVYEKIWQKDAPDKKYSFKLTRSKNSEELTLQGVTVKILEVAGTVFNDETVFKKLARNNTGSIATSPIDNWEDLGEEIYKNVVCGKFFRSKDPNYTKWITANTKGIIALQD